MKYARNTVLAWFAAISLVACGGGAKQTGQGALGVVESVDAAAGQVTIDHGEIPGLMGAMTMTFAVSDPALLEGIEVGNSVVFDVKYEKGSYRVTAIRKQ